MTKPSKKPFNKTSDDRLKTFQKPSKKPFKPLQKSNGAMSKDAQPIHLEDDVPDFPRGFKTSIIIYKLVFEYACRQVFKQCFLCCRWA